MEELSLVKFAKIDVICSDYNWQIETNEKLLKPVNGMRIALSAAAFVSL
jgi:hypothetical protein